MSYTEEALSKTEDQLAVLSAMASVASPAPYSFTRYPFLKKAYVNIDKTHCAKCSCKIPPGKAGRKCKACR